MQVSVRWVMLLSIESPHHIGEPTMTFVGIALAAATFAGLRKLMGPEPRATEHYQVEQ